MAQFNHSYCGNTNTIDIVRKGHENDNNTVIKCSNGNTSVSGMNFRDLMLRTIHPDKSQIKGMDGKDFDLFRFKLINPKRCEVSKMADGDFTIHRNIPDNKSVKAVYQVEKDGNLTELDFKVKGNVVDIKTNTLSIYDTVIEYGERSTQKQDKDFSFKVLCGSCNMIPVERELEFEVENLKTKKIDTYKSKSGKGKFNLREDQEYEIRLKENNEYQLETLTIKVKNIDGKIVALGPDNKVFEEILINKLDYSKESVDKICDFSDNRIAMAPIPIMVKEGDDLRPLGDTEYLFFTLYNLTRSERVGTFMAYEGELASLFVYENDDYMLTTGSNNDQFILSDTPFEKEVNEFYFKANGRGQLPIRHKTKNPYAEPANTKIEYLTIRPLEKGEMIKDKYTIDYVRIKQDKNNPKDYSNVKLIFTSEYDTVTATTLEEDDWGVPITPIELYDGVQYSVKVEDSNNEFAIENFPFTLVDKSERGPTHPLGWEDGKYVFNQTTCANATFLTLVPKGKENDNNTEVKSDDGSTVIKGMNFGDLMLKTILPEKSSVSKMRGKDFDLFRFNLINPHRCEITKMADGDFTIQRSVPKDKAVKAVYQLDKFGNLKKLAYEEQENFVNIKTKTLSIYDFVIEYESKKEIETPEPSEPEIKPTPQPETKPGTKPESKPETKPENKIFEGAELQRQSGKDRYKTAVEISKKNFNSAETVILVNGMTESDALSASVLAKEKNAPILLIKKDSTPEEVKQEIERLGAKNIIVIGGNSSVSKKATEDLKQKVETIAGKDRFETAVKIAKAAGKTDKLVIANGITLVDALTASSIAQVENRGIILVKEKEIPQSAKEIIENAKDILIVGGKSSVNLPLEADRISGKDRFETAVKIAERAFKNPKQVALANSTAYADALVFGAVTEKTNAPILLTRKDSLPDVTKAYLEKNKPEKVYILGGEDSVSTSLFK